MKNRVIYVVLAFQVWYGCVVHHDTPMDNGQGQQDLLPFDFPVTGTNGSCDGNVRILMVSPWPNYGVQITFEMAENPNKKTLPVVEMETLSGSKLLGKVEHLDITKGFTVIGVIPDADELSNNNNLEKVESIISGLPEGEMIGLVLLDQSLTIVSDITGNKKQVIERIQTIKPKTPTSDLSPQISILQELVNSLGERYEFISKFVIVVGNSPGTLDLNPDHPVKTIFIDKLCAEIKTCGEKVRQVIDESRSSIYRAGICLSSDTEGKIKLFINQSACLLETPAPIEHMVGVKCNETSAASDDYPYGDSIFIKFTPEQRNRFEKLYQSNSKDDFDLSIAIGQSKYMEAKAHFRGQTSLDCQRKSMAVNLKNPQPRRLGHGISSDEFFLISLCNDNGYFVQVFAAKALRELGLFPMQSRYVKLYIDGVNQGVYMILEKPVEAILEQTLRLRAVIRRGFDPDKPPDEIKYPSNEAGSVALSKLHQVTDLVNQTTGEKIVDTLSTVLDLDGYLTWMAFNTFMKNGDYCDEVLFYSSVEGFSDAWFWRIVAWDPKDILKDCHHFGKFALIDPHEILYCAEANIDKALLKSDKMYEMFIEKLKILLDDILTNKVLENYMIKTKTELFSILNDDETASAMIEMTKEDPKAGTVTNAHLKIEKMMQNLLEGIEKRRLELKKKIEEYEKGKT